MSLINVVDLNGSGNATIQHYELAETVRPWFPLPPPEVTQSIDSLQVALNAYNFDQVDAICAYLGLSIQVIGAAETPTT